MALRKRQFSLVQAGVTSGLRGRLRAKKQVIRQARSAREGVSRYYARARNDAITFLAGNLPRGFLIASSEGLRREGEQLAQEARVAQSDADRRWLKRGSEEATRSADALLRFLALYENSPMARYQYHRGGRVPKVFGGLMVTGVVSLRVSGKVGGQPRTGATVLRMSHSQSQRAAGGG